MVKTIVKEGVLALFIIVLQVLTNMANGHETKWFTVIGIGLLVGVADYAISYMKDSMGKNNTNFKAIGKNKR